MILASNTKLFLKLIKNIKQHFKNFLWSSVSPTNQDLSNDTTSSQINSCVPVPLSMNAKIYIWRYGLYMFYNNTNIKKLSCLYVQHRYIKEKIAPSPHYESRVICTYSYIYVYTKYPPNWKHFFCRNVFQQWKGTRSELPRIFWIYTAVNRWNPGGP